MSTESTTDVEMAEETSEDKNTIANGLDGLPSHEVRQLIVHPDAPLYDGMKSIRHVRLLDFFKMMYLIIASTIDSRQHKTEVSIDWARFMIRVARMMSIDRPSVIFARMRSETTYVTMDILSYVIMIIRYLLKSGLLPDVAKHVWAPSILQCSKID